MKILILSAATGGGHLRASHALQGYIAEHAPGSDVTVVDALKSISSVLDKTVCDGYHFLATKTPKVFGQLYRKTNEESILSTLVSRFSSVFSQKLIPLMEQQKPDIIISTHPFATEMVSHLKRTGVVRAPLICLMTDYGPHRAWIADNVDAYVVSTQDMVPEMVGMGVQEEKIYPFGIPVPNVFFSGGDKPALLQKLGLEPGLPTILIMAGSFGVTNILKIYRQLVRLDADFQVVVITGRNEKLHSAFAQEIKDSPKKTKLVYFTNEVENYMHASDLLITKPGGLTVTEALACSIPLAVFDAIPGQEEDNANFLLTHNMAVKLEPDADCAETIRSLLENSQELDSMRTSCAEFDKSKSAKNILALMRELYEKSLPAAGTSGFVRQALSRIYVSDLASALAFYEPLLGLKAEDRFRYEKAGLELARVGNLLIIAGSDETLAPFRETSVTFLVDDLGETRKELLTHGAQILRDTQEVPTGHNLTVRHPDGTVAEYVEHDAL